MNTKNDGIQQLLQAEKKAAEKVNEARKRKARRLKQAKQEAEVEINAERAERERNYKEHEAEILGSKGDAESQINAVTTQTLAQLQRNVQTNRERALQLLISAVFDIKLDLHTNYKSIAAMASKNY